MAARSVSAVAVADIISRAVQPLLKQQGFKKAGATFRRAAGDCIQVLNVQSSRWNSPEAATFTINVGVFFPAVHSLADGLLGPPSLRGGPAEYNCTVRKRIGSLIPPTTDLWWTVRPGESTDRVVEEVRAAVRDVALPWLDRASNPTNARNEAQPVAAMLLSVVQGDLETARALAAKLKVGTAAYAWAREHELIASP